MASIVVSLTSKFRIQFNNDLNFHWHSDLCYFFACERNTYSSFNATFSFEVYKVSTLVSCKLDVATFPSLTTRNGFPDTPKYFITKTAAKKTRIRMAESTFTSRL